MHWYNFYTPTWYYTLKQTPWSTEEIDILQEIYKTQNKKDIGANLYKLSTRTKAAIHAKALALGISRKTSVRGVEKKSKAWEYSIDPRQFFTPQTPEVCYILGLLWADGYIVKDNIRLETTKNDMDHFYPILLKTGKWAIHERTRQGRCPKSTVSTNNRPLAKFLRSLGYGPNSKVGMEKIMKIIPDNYKPFFLQGLIDGDGSYYVGKYSCQFNISAKMEQDWGYLIWLFSLLGIPCKIYRSKPVYKSQYSALRITNRKIIIKLASYLYSQNKNLSLPRKIEKLKLMDKDSCLPIYNI